MPLVLAATLIMAVSIHHLQHTEKKNAAIYSSEEKRGVFLYAKKKV